MNEETKQKLDAILQTGYDFKFGDYIGRGFEIFQKYLGGFILFSLVFLVLYFVASIVGSFVPVIGSFAVSLFLAPQLIAGFYLVAHQVHRRETPEFGGFFKGFEFMGPLALMTLVQSLLIIASAIPFILAVYGNSDLIQWYIEHGSDPRAVAEGNLPENPPPAWTFLLLLPAIYLSVAYSFAPMMVVFYRLDFWNALEYSRKLITKKWFVYFAFNIVLGIIFLAGFILLCIGVLASLPAVMCMIYAAFEDITQLNRETGSSDNIEKHLIV